MGSDIDISGIDKARLLEALYESAKPQGLGFLHFKPGPLPDGEASRLLEEYGYRFDYLHGRVMKVDISGDTFDPRLFDRDNGQGAAAMAVESTR